MLEYFPRITQETQGSLSTTLLVLAWGISQRTCVSGCRIYPNLLQLLRRQLWKVTLRAIALEAATLVGRIAQGHGRIVSLSHVHQRGNEEETIRHPVPSRDRQLEVTLQTREAVIIVDQDPDLDRPLVPLIGVDRINVQN